MAYTQTIPENMSHQATFSLFFFFNTGSTSCYLLQNHTPNNTSTWSKIWAQTSKHISSRLNTLIRLKLPGPQWPAASDLSTKHETLSTVHHFIVWKVFKLTADGSSALRRHTLHWFREPDEKHLLLIRWITCGCSGDPLVFDCISGDLYFESLTGRWSWS